MGEFMHLALFAGFARTAQLEQGWRQTSDAPEQRVHGVTWSWPNAQIVSVEEVEVAMPHSKSCPGWLESAEVG